MSEAEREKAQGLGRTVVALGGVSLFSDVASEMVYPQIPLFLTRVLGAPAWAVGLVEGVAESTASLFKLISGWYSDRIGRRKPLVLLGYGLGTVSKPLMALAVVWPFVLLLRFLDRVGKGIRTSPRDALIAESTPLALRGRAFGLHRTMDTMGAVIGPLLGWWFLRAVSPDVRNLFLFAGVPGLVALCILALFVRERAPAIDAKPESDKAKPGLPRWRDLSPEYRRFLGIVFLFGLGNSSDTFLILRSQNLGVSESGILLLYGAFNVVEVVFGYAAGGLSDRVGRKPLIAAGWLVFAAVYLGFALARGPLGACLLFLLYGGYYTLTQGTLRAFAADLADPARRATQIGAYHLAVGLAALPASLIAGALYSFSPALPFTVGATTATLSALALLRPKRSEAAPRDKDEFTLR